MNDAIVAHLHGLSIKARYDFHQVLLAANVFGAADTSMTLGRMHVMMAAYAQYVAIERFISENPGTVHRRIDIGRICKTELYIRSITDIWARSYSSRESKRLGITDGAFRARMLSGNTKLFVDLRPHRQRRQHRVRRIRKSIGRPPKAIEFNGLFATMKSWLSVVGKSRAWVYKAAASKGIGPTEFLLGFMSVCLGADWKPDASDTRFFSTEEGFEQSQ